MPLEVIRLNWKLSPPRAGALAALVALMIIMTAACGSSPAGPGGDTGLLALPDVAPLVEDGGRLRVLATTSIIGDVVGRVGGDAIDLTVLMRPGQDPHSYQPGAADLTAAADADIIFINGWNLEEGLVADLTAIGREAVIVPVSAGIQPRFAGATAHESPGDSHGPADPHVWLDPANVIQWTENIRLVLGAADPANAAAYDANAAAYRAALSALDEELRATLAATPAGRRVLVTDHDNLGYFAAAYDFEVIGAIIPSISTLAEPTAGALADLVALMTARNACTLVLDTTTSDQLARTLEAELAGCDDVRLVTLYTGALGPAGSGADSYTGLMRANAAALVDGLDQGLENE